MTVLERQPQMRDRVMGEALAPWGVAEAIELDVFELMRPHKDVVDQAAVGADRQADRLQVDVLAAAHALGLLLFLRSVGGGDRGKREGGGERVRRTMTG